MHVSKRKVTSALVPALLAGVCLASSPASAEPQTGGFACETGERVVRQATRLSAVAASLREGRPVRILAIGSSSTEGVGASSPTGSYPAQLQAALQRRWRGGEVTVVNAGVGGETALRTLERLDAQLGEERYDLVLWQVGTNDAVRGDDEDAFRSLLERGIQRVRQARADLVLVDQQFFPTIGDLQRYERFVQIVAEAAGANGVPLFSRYRLMRGWGARGEDALRETLASDAFHMNDVGYSCLGRMLATDLAGMARMGTAVAGGR